jgi:hypothetical protein
LQAYKRSVALAFAMSQDATLEGELSLLVIFGWTATTLGALSFGAPDLIGFPYVGLVAIAAGLTMLGVAYRQHHA